MSAKIQKKIRKSMGQVRRGLEQQVAHEMRLARQRQIKRTLIATILIALCMLAFGLAAV